MQVGSISYFYLVKFSWDVVVQVIFSSVFSHKCQGSFQEVAFAHEAPSEAAGASQTEDGRNGGDQRGEARGQNMDTSLPNRCLCGWKPSCALRSA